MAKSYKIPNFRKLYPEASKEVIAVLRKTERKMQYQEYDLKTEEIRIDHKAQTVRVIPSREDSYERLLEQDVQFAGENQTEQLVMQRIEFEQLHKAINLLSDDEQYLIRQLFFEERTERDLAKELNLYHNAVHKRKNRILEKLKNILKNF